jgi:hypothetical protein
MLLGRASIWGTKLRMANLSRRVFKLYLCQNTCAHILLSEKDTEAHILFSICPLASSFTTKYSLLPFNRRLFGERDPTGLSNKLI